MKTREEVAATLQEIQNLPTLPMVATRVLEMTESTKCSQQELAGVVEKDPAIATRLLKLVNSPFYGLRGSVGSVQQALLFVGMSNIRNLVLSSSVTDLFSDEGVNGEFDRAALWQHSMATALVARSLAKDTGAIDPEIAFTSGLIHDVGKVVIDRFFHEDFTRILELLTLHEATMADAENAVLGLDHGAIGSHLAGRWGLPEILREAIEFHHEPDRAKSSKQLAALIGMADVIARDLKVGTGGGTTPTLTEEHFTFAKISEHELDDFKAAIADEIEDSVTQLSSI